MEIPRWQVRRDLLAAGAAGEYFVHRFCHSRTYIPIHYLLLDIIGQYSTHTHTSKYRSVSPTPSIYIIIQP